MFGHPENFLKQATSDAVLASVNQAAHGFVVGNALYLNGTSFAKAKADVIATAEAVGLVVAVIDTNNFILQTGGRVTGLSGLTAGTVYFLSDSTAGLLTTPEPSTIGSFSKPLLVADSTASGYFFNFRGIKIGGPSIPIGGLSYQWSTDTTATNPGFGFVKIDNASLGSAATLYVNEKDGDGRQLGSIFRSSNRLFIYDPATPSNFAIYDIVFTTSASSGGNTWETHACSVVQTNGSFANNAQLRIAFCTPNKIPAGGAKGAPLTKASTADFDLTWTPPLFQLSSPGNPTGNATSTQLMQGLGVTFTPQTSGRILIILTGQCANSIVNDGISIQPRFGTGSAPANGDAATGTALNTIQLSADPKAAGFVPFAVFAVPTSPTVGTTYWFDCSIANITGGTASLTNLKVISLEF